MFTVSKSSSNPQPKTVYYSDYNQIEPGLYLGNDETGKDLQSLKQMGVTHVLVAGLELQTPYPESLRYLKLNIRDTISENITQHFQIAADFIRQGRKQGAVLVHCKYGISRSSTLMIAYFMKERKMSMEKAFCLVRSRRDAAQPNTEFMRQLRTYEKKLAV